MKNQLHQLILIFAFLLSGNLSIAHLSENNMVEETVVINDMIIVGLLDGPLSGTPKFVELYIVNDIPDLSIYGIGSANNGGGTDGQEWTFPADAATAGSTIYVVNDVAAFTTFMGFDADYEDGGAACNFNGDDGFELFENGTVIDVFGEISIDGTGMAWEHTDGWVKRMNQTGPDGTTFVVGNWTYSALDVFDGQTTNATSPMPYPTATYSPSGGTNLTSDLTIKGIIYASADLKATEYEVKNDIADLSIYGLGCSNNGGGSDGVEWSFPAVSASAGDRIYVARDSMAFRDFFGFDATFLDTGGDVHNFNGDDGLELFKNATHVEMYGDTLADGTGLAWEYVFGWAHRVDGTGPDLSGFVLGNWELSALDNYNGIVTNAAAPQPYPVEGGGGPSVTNNLVLVGLIHSGADVKATEYYVKEDIADLSTFGLGCANNGGGSDGQEWTFPAVAASAGDRIYVARDSMAFNNFFGFNATFTDPAGDVHNFNGDDGFELFELGTSIDIYGDTLLDGTGLAWEYSESWAQRVCATGPDGSFVQANWTVAPIDNLNGVANNAAAVTPYPVDTYQPTPCGGSNSNSLILVGIMHSGADVKASEYYVHDDIADLSIFGLGLANNGGGTDGQEFTFPAVSATAGDRIYVARDSMGFRDFFGFDANFIDSASMLVHNFNGDDALEVFENGEVIDIFGEINMDGTGTAWEYSDSWVSRKCTTGPDGTTFVLENWTVATLDVLDGLTTNAASTEPYPFGTYMTMPCDGPGSGGGIDVVMTEIMYNPPGTDLEYIEFYNNTATGIDMTGYHINNAIEFTFPNFTLASGEYALITDDSVAMENFWGITAFQWTTGTLNNSGEPITLLDAMGVVVDSVNYDDAAPWSSTADGRGPSLELCFPSSENNDGSNWQRAISSSGNLVDGREVFGSPGVGSACTSDPIIGIQSAQTIVGEADGTVNVLFYIDNPNANPTTVDISLVGGTADGSDYTFAASTITFPAMTDTSQMISIDIIDDMDEEPEENFTIQIGNPTNGALITNDTMSFTIIDNDAPITNSLVLIGLAHGPLGGVPKAVQILAINDISNLSLYGLGCANNGGGSDGQEYTFPPVAIAAGTCFWVTNDTTGFTSFFGFDADFQDEGAANNFNGDDAYELFESGTVIDVFGEIDADGTGTAWEYSLGWVHRVPGSGSDGSTFNLANWEIGGINALANISTNAEAANPYPTDACQLEDAVENVDLSQNIRVYPNPVTTTLQVDSDIFIENIRMTNLLGQTVLDISNTGFQTSINVNNLPPEIYLISFISENKTWTKKVIVNP